MRRLLVPLWALAALIGGNACAADLRLLTIAGFRPVALDMVPIFERESGHKVRIEHDTGPALVRRIQAGEKFDVVVLTQQALDLMVGERKIVDESITPLAKQGYAAAAKLSIPRPDVSNIEALRRTLLEVRSVAYINPSAGVPGGLYLRQLFQRLGVLPEVERKSVLVTSGLAAQRVASGQADLAIQQASEILAVPGVQYLGLLPAPIQNYTIYSGAVGLTAQDQDAAAALLETLAQADETAVLKRRAMEVP